MKKYKKVEKVSFWATHVLMVLMGVIYLIDVGFYGAKLFPKELALLALLLMVSYTVYIFVHDRMFWMKKRLSMIFEEKKVTKHEMFERSYKDGRFSYKAFIACFVFIGSIEDPNILWIETNQTGEGLSVLWIGMAVISFLIPYYAPKLAKKVAIGK